MNARQKIAVAMLLVLYLIPIWLYGLFPSQDGPSHLYNTIIFTELLSNPKSFFAHFYEINWHPFPNWTFTVFAALFATLFSMLVVEKIILSLYLTGFICAAFYFLRSLNAEKTVLGFGSFLFSYNWFLLMGFYNFCLSIPLALFVIGFGVRHRGAMQVRRGMLFALLFLGLYLSHIVSFGIATLVLAFLVCCFGQNRRRALTELGLAISPAAILFAIHFFTQPKVVEPTFRAPLSWLAANTLSFKIGPWFHPLESVWLVGLWLVLGLWLLQSLRQRDHWLSQDRAWWLVVGGVFALSVVLPNNLLGGSALNERLSFFVGLFLLGTLSLRAWAAPRIWLGVAFALLVGAQLAYVHVTFYDWNRRLEPFRRIATQMDRNAMLLPLVFAENVVGFYVNPMLHADSYLLAQTRSVSPTNYEGYRNYFPVRYRDKAPLAAPADWFKPQTFLGRDMARHYAYVLLVGADKSIVQHPALHEFVEVATEGDVRLLKHR